MNVVTFIRNMIKRGTVSRETADNGQFSVAQVKWGSSKVGNVEVILPYGVSSYAPVGSLALMFNVMGQESNRAAIINDPKMRFKDLKPGEVAVGNFLTRSVIKFLENGDIEITGVAGLNVSIAGSVNIAVEGDTVINTSGTTKINSTGNTTVTSPVVTVEGALRATGEISAFYGTPNEINFTDIQNKYNIHTHISSGPGSPTSVPSNTLP